MGVISTTYEELKKKFTKINNNNDLSELSEYINLTIQYWTETGWNVDYRQKDGKIIRFKVIDHFPELKEYEVWMEGYVSNDEHGNAYLVDKVKARCFGQACHIVMCGELLKHVKRCTDPTYKYHIDASRWDYNPNTFTFYGCRLHWSEKVVRKSFG